MPADACGPIPMLLWSAFGHPRREIRWRAAHATRELLAHPDPAATAPLAAALVRCLDHADPGAFRDPALHFYRLSASRRAARRAATGRRLTDPALLVPHLDELIRHATSRDLPHAQIRELARQAALAVADPADPRTDTLRYANQPTAVIPTGNPGTHGSDRRISEDRRYRFDQMDTLPYWYAPLARVFDIPVDTVAELAEGWILDRWGLGEDDWWTDARELRDQQSWKRTSHRQGSIPPEENLQLYLEYHAMMTAAGELIDAGRPISNQYLGSQRPVGVLALQLTCPQPRGSPTCVHRSRPSPRCSASAPLDGPGTTRPDRYDQAFGLKDGQLANDVLVAANATVHRPGGHERHLHLVGDRPPGPRRRSPASAGRRSRTRPTGNSLTRTKATSRSPTALSSCAAGSPTRPITATRSTSTTRTRTGSGEHCRCPAAASANQLKAAPDPTGLTWSRRTGRCLPRQSSGQTPAP